MTKDTQSARHGVGCHRAGDIAAELTSLLQNADKPLTLGELSQLLGRNFRAIAWALAAACRAGTVDRLEAGRYALVISPSLAELFAHVRACETAWEDSMLRSAHDSRTSGDNTTDVPSTDVTSSGW
jgi:hypothetical protein